MAPKGKEEIMADVRRNIRRLRVMHSLSQKSLGEIIGKSESQIGAYETGASEITISVLAEMATAFGGRGRIEEFFVHEETPEEYIGNWDFEIRVFKQEDRRTITGILAENGYDVGYHKRRRTRTGKAVDYYIHGRDYQKMTGGRDDTE